MCCKVGSWCKCRSFIGKKKKEKVQGQRNSLTTQDWPQGRLRVWEASYCIVVEGLNSNNYGCKNHWQSWGGHNKCEPWKSVGGGKWGEDVMKTKNVKIYRLQTGRDARGRWSSVCVGLCTRPPALRSSVDDVLQTGRTAGRRERERGVSGAESDQVSN